MMQDMQDRLRGSRGFSLLESLAVMVILAIMLAAIAPMVAERMQQAKVRTSVSQFSLDLRAARWTAVSSRATVDLIVIADPANAYEYTDVKGKLRRIQLPDGVRIASSTNPIQFRANGSVLGGASTVIEAQIADDTLSRWTIDTSSLGISRTMHQRVAL
jgi:prepilin-type N-terminal cleavage/methylation domain-containing protein